LFSVRNSAGLPAISAAKIRKRKQKRERGEKKLLAAYIEAARRKLKNIEKPPDAR